MSSDSPRVSTVMAADFVMELLLLGTAEDDTAPRATARSPRSGLATQKEVLPPRGCAGIGPWSYGARLLDSHRPSGQLPPVGPSAASSPSYSRKVSGVTCQVASGSKAFIARASVSVSAP